MVRMMAVIPEAQATAPNRSPARSTGARERIMATARRLFYTRGINATGIDLDTEGTLPTPWDNDSGP